MQLTAFVDAGGTLVDTADVYCDGESERVARPPAHRRRPAVRRAGRHQGRRPHGARPDGPRRVPRAPARRARRLPRAAGPGLRRPLAAARLGRRHAARGDAGRLRPRRLLRPRPLRRHQQLHRLADRAGRDLAARLARPHAAGQHAGRVLAAAARRRARGRPGRGVARPGRAGVVAAGPRPADRQVPAQHAVGVPRRLAAVAGLHRRAALARSPTGSSRRSSPPPRAWAPRRSRSRWPGCATGRASSRRSSAPAPPQQLQASLDADGVRLPAAIRTALEDVSAPPFSYPERRSEG